MESKEIWESIINDAKWHDGNNKQLERLIKHLDSKYVVFKRVSEVLDEDEVIIDTTKTATTIKGC